ncbi:neuroligin-4, X-linked-like [Mytilus galloprovincialis]|uniref:neuroligin-4, X-linked-like n=1 Tax=Mytilus galloprovincialis TaxID=29158 RepID=UPI003F7BDEF0
MYKRIWNLFALLLYPVYSFGEISLPTEVIVSTELGQIKGLQMDTNGKAIQSFIAIPYAEPPKRFEKPEPLKSWGGIIDGTITGGRICSQVIADWMVDFLPSGDISEDCLLLDLFVPVSDTTSNKAVVIWFAGEKFESGQRGLLPTSDLVLYGDVINVVVAFRLGVFGFFSTGDSVIPGNFGLWDQKMAIEWVKSNIQAFGGDPSRITLGGFQSTGLCTTLQASSPLNFGNFQRVMLFSTVANTHGALWKKAEEYSQTLANQLCPDASQNSVVFTSQQIYDCLMSKTESEILEKAPIVSGLVSTYSDTFWYHFGPVVDNEFILPTTDFKSLIPVDVVSTLSEYENFINVYEQLAPLQTQYNFETSQKVPKTVLCNYYIPNIISPFYQTTKIDDLKKMICDWYSSSDEKEQSRNVLRAIGDFFTYAPVTDLLNTHLKTHSNKKVYLSFWSEISPANSFMQGNEWMNGTIDVDAMLYLLQTKTLHSSNPDVFPDFLISLTDSAIKYYSNFIKTGNPNDDQLTQTWPQYLPDDKAFLKMSVKMSTGSNLFQDRVNFWLNNVPHFLNPTTTKISTTSSTTTTTTTTTATFTTTTPKPVTKTTKRPLVIPKSTTVKYDPANSSVTTTHSPKLLFASFIILLWVVFPFL